MALSLNQKGIVQKADRIAIRKEYTAISKNWKNQQWLQRNNRYRSDVIKRIKTDSEMGRSPVNAQLRQYIAASSIAHCMDGWGYIGRAIEASLKGDSNISRHLGYYAELRAAMALLAAEGIGIFNNTHFVVDNSRCCEQISGQRTHIFTWEALDWWASTNTASELLFQIIEPGGLPLSEWLNRFSVGAVRQIIAEKWLKQWGLDIKRLAEDKEARNTASYRPTSFTSSYALTPTSTLNPIKDFWRLFEPFESHRFPKLDRYLLRKSLELFFQEAHAAHRSPRQASAIYSRQIKAMLRQISPRDLTIDDWYKFLMDDDLPLLLESAQNIAGPSKPDHHMHVFARASLLLRLATGTCQKLLASVSSTNMNYLHFWWSRIGKDHCLWHIGNEPLQLIDLWTDIRESLNEIDWWCKNRRKSGNSYHQLWRERASAVGVLGTCERIGLWGLGL